MNTTRHRLPTGSFEGILLILAAGLLAAGLAGCRPSSKTAEVKAPPRVEDMSSGPIQCFITAEPPEVHLDRDILLTITTKAPTSMEVRLPALETRLNGFILNGAFDREPVAKDGTITREHCVRLTPTLAKEYRLSPMAISYTDRSQQPSVDRWFATRPMVFMTVPLMAGQPPSMLADILGPIWIYPSFKTVMLWMAAILLLAAAMYGLWRLSRRIHRRIQLRRMSPKERALHELTELMARDLIPKNQIKAFYLEITMIVRRYIERAHAIRAPEQTTEEFLVAVTQNPRFSREVVLKLKTFLQTADLVKFAAFRPDTPTVDKTIATARDYIETDEQKTSAQQQEAGYV